MARCPDTASQRAVLEAFKSSDPHGNGLIQREEFSKVLRRLDTAFWTTGRLNTLFENYQGDENALRYEDFVHWLFKAFDFESSKVSSEGEHSIPAARGPGSFSFMTFNVEEYHHGHSSDDDTGGLKESVFGTIGGLRKIIEEHMPDVLCLEEHSLGSGFTEKDIMEALLGDLGYDYVSEATGEEKAWYSGLANAVAWKGALFKLKQSWRVELAGKTEMVPGASKPYTARAATCAELEHLATGRSLVVCATHLLGGRFEDTTFVAEQLAGRNVRSEQVRKIAESIKVRCGDDTRSVIAGDFNVMYKGYCVGSPFRSTAEQYFQKLLGGAMALMATSKPKQEDYPFDGFFVPFQMRVHETLRQELGYCVAYGREDNVQEMKTTFYSGCIDWVYIRNLRSFRDERVISAIKEGLSDHNAVMVTLDLD